MLVFVTVIHVLLCVFMIFVILLQPGKDAGMGSALGGGAATSAFGGRGAVTFLSKLTAACAVMFFLTSLGLSFVGLKSSVAEAETEEAAPPAMDAGEASEPGSGAHAPASDGNGSAAPSAAGQGTSNPLPPLTLPQPPAGSSGRLPATPGVPSTPAKP